MCFDRIFVFVLFVLLSSIYGLPSNSKKNVQIMTYEYDKEYTFFINNSVEYIFEHLSNKHDYKYPARISVDSSHANRSFPLFITTRQTKGIQSWQLPVSIGDTELHRLSRTLCPHNDYFLDNLVEIQDNVQNHPSIHFYTSSPSPLIVNLMVRLVKDFHITSNNEKHISTNPSEPMVYFYSFQNDLTQKTSALKTTDNKKTVIVKMESKDDVCMLISIQNASCPIFDTENDIMFEGFYETVSRKGGITVTQQRYPLGFYIVLLVKTSDEDCFGFSTNHTDSHFFEFESQPFDVIIIEKDPHTYKAAQLREKNVVLEVYPSISKTEYWIGTTVTLAVILLIYITFIAALIFYKYKPMNIDEVDSPDSIAFIQSQADNTQSGRVDEADNSVALECRQHVFLNQLCTEDINTIKKRSDVYLWTVITVSVFYGLPVIQLVVTYQRILNQSGNQDLCYYNFLCAHPLGYLSDFNHLYSNLGYVLLGILFLFITWRRQKRHTDNTFDQYFGIPQHYGLYYAMGVALMMEGVFSASYHVCPNHSNFQFDTSFMYIIAVLCMVKIYQTRHPDINARAHSTFGILAGAILICLFGVLYPNFYFWIFFTILHISLCLILTFQIYYLGQRKLSDIHCGNFNCKENIQLTQTSRLVMVVIANLCNLALAGYGLYMHSKDFATHLLYVFLMNLGLHLTFYIAMKLTKGEKPTVYVWSLLVMALITWSGALYFFFDLNTSWAVTPAQSRIYNSPCLLFKFYDSHDIWHILSAAALFFSFMLMLTLDDDLNFKLRNDIPVF